MNLMNFLLQQCEVAVIHEEMGSERICDLVTTAQPAGGSLEMNSGLHPSKNSYMLVKYNFSTSLIVPN